MNAPVSDAAWGSCSGTQRQGCIWDKERPSKFSSRKRGQVSLNSTGCIEHTHLKRNAQMNPSISFSSLKCPYEAKYQVLAYFIFSLMLKYLVLLHFSDRVDPFLLEKATNGSFAKWISSNVWYSMHVANNDATQYCETCERGAAEIRSQKRDRLRVEVRAGGKVVVAGWIYRPCRFIEMSPSVFLILRRGHRSLK